MCATLIHNPPSAACIDARINARATCARNYVRYVYRYVHRHVTLQRENLALPAEVDFPRQQAGRFIPKRCCCEQHASIVPAALFSQLARPQNALKAAGFANPPIAREHYPLRSLVRRVHLHRPDASKNNLMLSVCTFSSALPLHAASSRTPV